MSFIILFSIFFYSFCEAAPPYGQLSVKDSKLLGSNGQQVQLVGMSLFWSNCGEGQVFYNYDTLKILKCNWNSNVVRAAMGVESDGCQRPGYLEAPITEREKVEAVVKAAIQLDMYVIIDFHTNNAPAHLDKAIEFFTYFATNYGSKYPNILYETFNEPLQVDWSGVKAYHEKVVATIRKYDQKNIIILGTTTWSQDVDIASRNPVAGSNLCYTLHFYAATHKQNIRDKAQTALNNNKCVFVTEYGTVDNNGGGNPDNQSTNDWWTFMDKNKISYLNWALDNKGEGAAALFPNTVASLAGNEDRLTQSGRLVKNKLRQMNTGVSCSGGKSNNALPSLPVNKDVVAIKNSTSGNKNNNGDSSDNKGYPQGKPVLTQTTKKQASNDNKNGYPQGNPVLTQTTKKQASNDNKNGYPQGNPVLTQTTKKQASNDNKNGYPQGKPVLTQTTKKQASNDNKNGYPQGNPVLTQTTKKQASNDNKNGYPRGKPVLTQTTKKQASNDNKNGYPQGNPVLTQTTKKQASNDNKNGYPQGNPVLTQTTKKQASNDNKNGYPQGNPVLTQTTKKQASNDNKNGYPQGKPVLTQTTKKQASNDNKNGYPQGNPVLTQTTKKQASNDNKNGYPQGKPVLTQTTKKQASNDNKNGYPQGNPVLTQTTKKQASNDNKNGYPQGNSKINLTTKLPLKSDNNGAKYPGGNAESKTKQPNSNSVAATKLPKEDNGECENDDITHSSGNNNPVTKSPSANYPGGNVQPKTKQPNLNSVATTTLPKEDEEEEDDEECACEDDDDEDNDDETHSSVASNAVTKSPSNNQGSVPKNEGNSSISLSVELKEKWVSGANFGLNFINNGESKACAIKFTLNLASGQTIQSIWNVQKVSENTYLLPPYVTIQAKNKYVDAGLVVNGPSTPPKIQFIEQGKCTNY